jgi:hypothetical protein
MNQPVTLRSRRGDEADFLDCDNGTFAAILRINVKPNEIANNNKLDTVTLSAPR